MLDPNYTLMNSKHIIPILIGLLASSFPSVAQDKPAAEPAAGAPVVGAPVVVTPGSPPAEATAPGVSTPAGASQPGAIIPIIVMDEAKLTDAIRNLARMAGMNYLLDPATGFNQIDPVTQKVKAEPTVSIRWEN